MFEGAHRRIGAGDVALANAGQLALRDAVDLGPVTAWQHDAFILNGQSLDYALGEINRYLPEKIVIGHPYLSRLRLGGTFATSNPAEFLQALRASFGVRATTSANGGIILTRT
jgi:transmembrane sensor